MRTIQSTPSTTMRLAGRTALVRTADDQTRDAVPLLIPHNEPIAYTQGCLPKERP